MSSTAIIATEGCHYPPPLASHDDIIKDPTLFWDTLRSFHSELGTKYMVPVIGGKELNLHILYVEVTNRGGYDKVVAEKKWREISSIFKFSPTTTSASYALRKHYCSLLYHYEQVYFFKAQGPLITSTAIGTIDGKFDCGYLVSVKLGSEILNGVLYYPDQPGPSIPPNQACTAIVPYNPNPHHWVEGIEEEGEEEGVETQPAQNLIEVVTTFSSRKSIRRSNLSTQIERGNSQNDRRILEQS